ncbi:GNAT family acetyltransferase [Jannaschia pagri]|uniref:GNAT family acetyltransferase n=1 Tax=Jannaschia pagri TaxID=2829797 RepID=A0ABQ4NKU0_9RHOB|nr:MULTISPECIES: GNAT family N-acetyltransferase [unclassified Jannaschia]GIT91198.1 GNAT family acetyltransferase [Jannaschia sp. AI_61]GIT95030.1 GNAT family acetyltransferase [Jannaschia sp. AI_62]
MIALAPTPILRTQRLTLRAPIATDWPGIRDFMASPRSRWAGGPLDRRNAWRLFGSFVGHWVLRDYGLFVYHRHDDPTPLGTVGPYRPEGWPEPEIGWTLWDPASEGQGYATEAARKTLAYARDTLRWASAVSYISSANTASIAVAERLGASFDPAATPNHDGALVYRHWGQAQ